VPGDPYRAPPVSGTFLNDALREPGRLRVAFSRTDPFGRPLHADCLAGVDATAKLLESLGHTVEEAQPQIEPQGFVEAFSAMWFAGIAYAIDLVSLQSGRTLQPGDLENFTHAVHARGRAISAVEFQFAELVMQQAGREMGRFHQTYDCWLTPTLATPPLRNGVIDVRESDLDKTYAPLIDYSPFTAMQNASGQPSISLPLHWSGAGLPVGMMFSADAGNEGLLFQLAAQLEQARPWKDRRPGMVLQHDARQCDPVTA
jgi:amidase